MKSLIKISPITHERFTRFRKTKRAWYSFVLLSLLFFLSICSEFLSNDKPLMVKYNGSFYFPIFSYLSEDTFLKNGINTRAKYKYIQKTEQFRKNKNNYMIFPIIPYGPDEVIEAQNLDIPRDIKAIFSPEPKVGYFQIRKDLSIKKAVQLIAFFGERANEFKGKNLSKELALTKELSKAIQDRFKNIESPAFSLNISHQSNSFRLNLHAYKKRKRAPKTLRINLRTQEKEQSQNSSIVFNKKFKIISDKENIWNQIDTQNKEAILLKIKERDNDIVEAMPYTLKDQRYNIRFEKEDIFFPYKPHGKHYFGLDNSGRDVFSRVLYATRISLCFGGILVISCILIGIIIGALQGFYGGLIDLIGQRFLEIWESLPFLYIIILMGAIYKPSILLLLFVYALFNWISISKYIRGEFFKLRKQAFVESAKIQGLSDSKIIFKHILPNALVPIITLFPFQLVGAIGSLATLDYLGFGLPPDFPSWGELLKQAKSAPSAYWLTLYPSLALFIVMLLGIFVGDGIRNAFDPRKFSRIE